MADRPVSPHLFVYRWGYTMTLSILHRFTGVALSVSLMGLVAWLISASLGPTAYGCVYAVLSSLPFRIVVAGAVTALIYHFCNGLRHLAWDMGWGFERASARRGGTLVVIVTLIATLICLYFLFCPRAA